MKIIRTANYKKAFDMDRYESEGMLGESRNEPDYQQCARCKGAYDVSTHPTGCPGCGETEIALRLPELNIEEEPEANVKCQTCGKMNDDMRADCHYCGNELESNSGW
jgi:Zn finger protein HypA/HybF involved in hydrogenase expression